MTAPEGRGPSLPAGFVWGAATSAAQIEGAAHLDGKRDSIWDVFARRPGAVAGGDTPEQACDHYHRMPEDVALLGKLNVGAYRFSASWARVLPDDGPANPAGLAFYDRLVDELLSRGITPWLTLYHWDLPQALQERGGWTSRATSERFARLAEVVHGALGDRVQHWITLNEPFCSAYLGYASGEHAPGRRDPAAAMAAVHHLNLGHGLAVQRLRELGAAKVGVSLNLTNAVPAQPDDPVDHDAARRVDALWNRAFLDPMLLGRYPADLLADVAHLGLAELVADGDLAQVAQPLDFLGVNHYHDDCVSGHPDPAAPEGSPVYPGSEFVTARLRPLPRTGMDWEIHPAGLERLLLRLGEQYPGLPPMYITENGAAFADVVEPDGVHDRERTEFLEAHLAAVGRAVARGADVRGFFAWSLLDNFEWGWGYGQRFGLVHVDFTDQRRTIKDSGYAFARLAAGTPKPLA